uniref:Uncharacterized protein n=1 Tax=Arundo donax TaxID=35708 RepID=A0A0A9HQT3_ARUDO
MDRSMESRSLSRFLRRLSAMRFFDVAPWSLLLWWTPPTALVLPISELSPAPPPKTNVEEPPPP